MYRKLILITVTALFLAATGLTAFAADGPSGNKRKGKYTYRKVVKACFQRGGVESATPTVSPSDKKMAQWKTLFESRDLGEFGCQDEWNALSDKDFQDIYSYFYHYAADSPTPATCK